MSFVAFLILRFHGCLLISLLAMTLSSGMPELQSEECKINQNEYSNLIKIPGGFRIYEGKAST